MILYPWYGWHWHMVLYSLFSVMALISHCRAQFTDPGAVPRHRRVSHQSHHSLHHPLFDSTSFHFPHLHPSLSLFRPPLLLPAQTVMMVTSVSPLSLHPIQRLTLSFLLTLFFPLSCSRLSAPRVCKRCKSIKPYRAHHCSTCSRCIIRMDHHWSPPLHHLPLHHLLFPSSTLLTSLPLLSSPPLFCCGAVLG